MTARDIDAAHVRGGSKADLLTQLGRLKSVSATPPIPGMTVMYRSTYANCLFLTHAAQQSLCTDLDHSIALALNNVVDEYCGRNCDPERLRKPASKPLGLSARFAHFNRPSLITRIAAWKSHDRIRALTRGGCCLSAQDLRVGSCYRGKSDLVTQKV
jgi:hypothetical protein